MNLSIPPLSAGDIDTLRAKQIPPILHLIAIGKSNYVLELEDEERFQKWKKYWPIAGQTNPKINLWIDSRSPPEGLIEIRKVAQQHGIILRDIGKNNGLPLHHIIMREIKAGNPWAAADTLKFSILYEEAGLVADIDKCPDHTTKPCDIPCLYGFLTDIGDFQGDDLSQVQITMKMSAAAYRYHPLVVATLKTIESNFDFAAKEKYMKEKYMKDFLAEAYGNQDRDMLFTLAWYMTGTPLAYVLTEAKKTLPISALDFPTGFKKGVHLYEPNNGGVNMSLLWKMSWNIETKSAAKLAWVAVLSGLNKPATTSSAKQGVAGFFNSKLWDGGDKASQLFTQALGVECVLRISTVYSYTYMVRFRRQVTSEFSASCRKVLRGGGMKTNLQTLPAGLALGIEGETLQSIEQKLLVLVERKSNPQAFMGQDFAGLHV